MGDISDLAVPAPFAAYHLTLRGDEGFRPSARREEDHFWIAAHPISFGCHCPENVSTAAPAMAEMLLNHGRITVLSSRPCLISFTV